MASKKLLAISKSTLVQACRGEHAVASTASLHPKIGNREIVGWGHNGIPNYIDIPIFPAPAVRFKEDTKEILALREKEKGDWKDLTLQEKKALYRSSFCRTYAEQMAPTGRWKIVVSGVLGMFTLTMWVNYLLKTYVLELPHTITKEWQHKQLENMVRQKAGPIFGMSSKWDYENNRWK